MRWMEWTRTLTGLSVRFQERVLPIAHFVARYGPTFVNEVADAFEEGDPRNHAIVALPSVGRMA